MSIFDLFGGSSSGDSAGARLTHSVDLENVRESQTDGWVSCASSAAPEVKALSYKLDTNSKILFSVYFFVCGKISIFS